MKDTRLLMPCDNCKKEYKVLYPVYDDKRNVISMVCIKCAKELTGGKNGKDDNR